MNDPTAKKEIITPDRQKTLLNQKTNSTASGNLSSVNSLQDANEKPLAEKKGNKVRFPVIKKVRKGDNLYRLTLNVYGSRNQELLEFVKKNNPTIKDNYEIRVGEKIIFPYWKEKKGGVG